MLRSFAGRGPPFKETVDGGPFGEQDGLQRMGIWTRDSRCSGDAGLGARWVFGEGRVALPGYGCWEDRHRLPVFAWRTGAAGRGMSGGV